MNTETMQQRKFIISPHRRIKRDVGQVSLRLLSKAANELALMLSFAIRYYQGGYEK